MITQTNVELERLYTFTYSGEKRLALVLEDQANENVLVWDFLNQSYKSFTTPYMSNVVDVTDKCVISECDKKWNDPSVRTFEYLGKQFAVRI